MLLLDRETVEGYGVAQLPRTFRQRVYELVRRIPPGRVMTYGQVALCLGAPRAGRVVGGALHTLPAGSEVPWHRIVNRDGRISTRCPEHSVLLQAILLREEGVAVADDLSLDLPGHRWWPDESTLHDLVTTPESLIVVELAAGAQHRANR
ncbi:MAG: MGMT family protein [Chloroflexi bacterium]|nr:MGMT family protein [Chloroflexota bacterium]